MKKIISLTLFLALASALAGAVLAGVNSITYPIIEENKIAAVKAELKTIFPSASEFKEVANFTDATGLVKNVYEATDNGYAMKVTVVGFNAQAPMTFLVAFDFTDKIIGFSVTSISETPGYGMKVGEEAFKTSLIGKNITDTLDTISGATISSTAVIKGIDAAIAVYQSLK